MYRLKSKTVGLLITTNHNIINQNTNGKFEVCEVQKILERSNKIVMPALHNGWKCGKYRENFILPAIYGKRTKKYLREKNNKERIINMNEWLKFLGIFFTDGNCYFNEKKGEYKVSIYQKKEIFLKDINELLKNLPFDFNS
jgi:intein/homing endonuclease